MYVYYTPDADTSPCGNAKKLIVIKCVVHVQTNTGSSDSLGCVRRGDVSFLLALPEELADLDVAE